MTLIGAGFAGYAQFPNTDSLRAYDNKYINNSAINAFTNLRLNTLLYGIINWIDSAKLGTTGSVGMDTLYNFNDSTLKYKKNGVFVTLGFKGVYDSRKKVDTAYSKNDSTLAILINGVERTILIRGNSKGNPSNVGSFYRLLVNGTNNFKTLAKGHGVLIDSTSNANAITFLADTAILYPEIRATITGGSGTPSGSNKQVQINNSGAFGAVPNFTANISTHEVSADSFDTHRVRTDSVRYTSTATFQPADTTVITGNSIAFGDNGTVIPDSTYAGEFAAATVTQLYNQGVPSTGILNAIGLHYLNINPNNQVQTVSEGGLNDARYGGGPRTVQNKVVNGTKAIFVNQNLYNFTAAGTAGTFYGTWNTSWPANSEGGKCSVGAFNNNHVGDSVTFSVITATTNPNIAIGWIFANSSTVYGSVYIDNVRVDSLYFGGKTDGLANNSSYSGTYIPGASIYTGLSAGTHKVKVIYGSGAGLLMIDYVGTLLAPTSCRPMIIMDLPHMDATGYATSPANATQAILDTISSRLDSLTASLAALGYPVYRGNTNAFYTASSPTTLSASDHIHPTNAGHRQIFNSLVSALLNLPATTPGNGTQFFSNNPYIVVNGQPTLMITALTGNTGYIQNQTASIQAASFNILSGKAHNLFADSVKIGGTNNENDAAVTLGGLGTTTKFPALSFDLKSGGVDSKIFRMYEVPNGTAFDFVNDAANLSSEIMEFDRTGYQPSKIKLFTNVEVTNPSGTGINIIPLANSNGVDASGPASISGFFRPFRMVQNVSAGIQIDLENSNTSSTGYVNLMMKTAGGSSASPYVTYADGTSALQYATGLHVASQHYRITNGLVDGGTNIFDLSTAGAALLPYYGSNKIAVDTNTYKILVTDGSGNVKAFNSWNGIGGIGGTADTLKNVGGGDSSLTNPSTKTYAFKTQSITGDGVNIIVTPTITSTKNSYVISAPNVVDGTYTPTLTNVANTSTTSTFVWNYSRVGNTITLSGEIDVTPTLTATLTQIGFTLPVATVFSTGRELNGTAASTSFASLSGTAITDISNSRGTLSFISVGTGSAAFIVICQYKVTPP